MDVHITILHGWRERFRLHTREQCPAQSEFYMGESMSNIPLPLSFFRNFVHLLRVRAQEDTGYCPAARNRSQMHPLLWSHLEDKERAASFCTFLSRSD